MKTQKNLFIFTAVALIGLFFAGSYFYKNAELKETMETAETNQQKLIRDYSPTKGDPSAKVTLVEFLDPECGTCAAYHPKVKGLLKKHDGLIHYVVRYAPFHQNAQFIIKILHAAKEQGKYWETLDLLFEKQPEWGGHGNPQPEKVWTFLPSLGLDIDKIKADMESPGFKALILQDIDDGMVFGVKKTPTFFVNGKPLESFGLQQLEAAIDAALAQN